MMNPRQLEAFSATIRTGSITGAAHFLGISQPSVSRLIAELEKSLEFKLFIRTGRGLAATVEARKFYQAVESMFLGLDNLRKTAEVIRTAVDGEVSLGVIPAFIHIVMPEAVADLQRVRKDLRIRVDVRNTPALLDAVLMQGLELGIISHLPPYEGVHVIHEIAVPYVCILPRKHPLANSRKPLDLNALVDEEIIALEPPYLENDSLLSKLRRQVRLSSHSVPAVASLARATGMAAIVDPYTAEIAETLGGVVTRPLRQELIARISIIARGEDTLSLAARELAQALIEQLIAPRGRFS